MTIPTTPIIPIGGETISLKEFKKMIKQLGYRVKTHVSYFGFGTPKRFLEVLDKDGNFVCGSGANAYPSGLVKQHQQVFDLLREYRGRVFDEEGDKVLF